MLTSPSLSLCLSLKHLNRVAIALPSIMVFIKFNQEKKIILVLECGEECVDNSQLYQKKAV